MNTNKRKWVFDIRCFWLLFSCVKKSHDSVIAVVSFDDLTQVQLLLMTTSSAELWVICTVYRYFGSKNYFKGRIGHLLRRILKRKIQIETNRFQLFLLENFHLRLKVLTSWLLSLSWIWSHRQCKIIKKRLLNIFEDVAVLESNVYWY